MKVLTISDLHLPFQHKDAFTFLSALKSRYQPHEVVCIGDEVDMHALSNFDKDPDGLSAGDELKAALTELKKLYKLFPKAKACTSNHTSRPFRQAFKFGIPSAYIKSYHEFLQAPKGWQWADCWELDGVLYEHGTGMSGQNGAIKAALANMQSTVIGHIHAFAGVQYSANPRHLIFGANIGCLIDKDRYAFRYAVTLKVKPILGTGLIIDGVPLFIPMQLNKAGRWTGKF